MCECRGSHKCAYHARQAADRRGGEVVDSWKVVGGPSEPGGFQMEKVDERYRTVDGVEIVEGLMVWDYDRELVEVKIEGTKADPKDDFYEYWDGWFDCYTADGRRKIMNGERLSVRG